mgnify:CR=1 FL=1|tara:strand:+ start:420 stop:653 length:234 start_codon:yes stop_codon:yes gene_type:complete
MKNNNIILDVRNDKSSNNGLPAPKSTLDYLQPLISAEINLLCLYKCETKTTKKSKQSPKTLGKVVKKKNYNLIQTNS